MDKAEREQHKVIHARFRAEMRSSMHGGGSAHRYALLAWAFVREISFRRIEARHCMQKLPDGTIYEHNMPSQYLLCTLLARLLPERNVEELKAAVKGWLAEPPRDPIIVQACRDAREDPKSAIFYPAVRVKPEAHELVDTVAKMARLQGKRRATLYIVLDGVVHRLRVEKLFRAMPRKDEIPIVTRSVPDEYRSAPPAVAIPDGAE